jgi:hypothetical protein
MNRFADSEVFERLEELGITRRKIFQFVGLFCFQVVIYSIYLSMHLKLMTACPDGVTFNDPREPLLRFCLISALPFALLAYSDAGWRSSDAAPVCAGAWFAVCRGLSSRISCPMTGIYLFIPFILAAVLAHGLGTLGHYLKSRHSSQAFS